MTKVSRLIFLTTNKWHSVEDPVPENLVVNAQESPADVDVEASPNVDANVNPVDANVVLAAVEVSLGVKKAVMYVQT